MRNLPLHFESVGTVAALPAAVFDYLDDQKRLGAHMSRSSWMMFGASMSFVFDEAEGRQVGSQIGLRGRILGLPIAVDEVVIERLPPVRKMWETIGSPRLLVIDHYRMGFEIAPAGEQSRIRVFIDYSRHSSILGLMFAGAYARWCVRTMLKDALRRFAPTQRHAPGNRRADRDA